MKAKDFFRQVARAEREMKLLQAQVRHYEDLGFSISGGGMDSPVVSHSRGSSRVEASAIGIYSATEELRAKIADFEAVVRHARLVIDQVAQEKYRQILTLRYLAGWSFRSISDELRYNDPNSIYRAHGWALNEAQKVLNREGKNGKDV